jgi:hypothetical protein
MRYPHFHETRTSIQDWRISGIQSCPNVLLGRSFALAPESRTRTKEAPESERSRGRLKALESRVSTLATVSRVNLEQWRGDLQCRA